MTLPAPAPIGQVARVLQPPFRSRLAFARAGPRTAIVRALSYPPLRVLTPRNHGAAAWAYTTTLGGGLVSGDEVRLELDVRDGARALVSSQGSQRIFRGPHVTAARTDATVGRDALLVLLPDPTACFAGSRCALRTSVSLQPRASLAIAELVTGGRSARDGRWRLSRFTSALTIVRGGATVCADALLLDPAHGPLPERLSRFDCLATIVLTGPLFARARIETEAPRPGAPLLEAQSPLADGGTLIRIAAASTELAQARVRALLAMLPQLLGDDPFVRRA